MRKITKGVPGEVLDDIARFRYRERFGLSGAQMAEEDDTSIQEAFFFWDLFEARAERDKLSAESQQPK